MGCADFFGMGGDKQDYGAAAREQGAANLETARLQGYLNNPNVYTQMGSREVGFGPNGQPSIYEVMSPAETEIYQRNTDIRNRGLQALGNYGIPAIEAAMKAGYSVAGTPQTDYAAGYKPGAAMAYGIGDKAPIQRQLDYSGAPAMPVANAGVRDQVARSLYDQGARFLDQRFGGQQKALDTRLSNQGLMPGSEAYGAGQTELGQERTQAYGDLMDRAIMGGGDAMQQLFGMGLGARQQGVGEISQQGEFYNQGQNQDVNQMLAELAARNAGVTNQYNIAGQQAALANAGRSQTLSELAFSNNAPINTMNAIMSGSQVNAPPTMQYNPTAIEAAPIFQAAQATGAQQTAGANRNANLWGQAIGAGTRIATGGF